MPASYATMAGQSARAALTSEPTEGIAHARTIRAWDKITCTAADHEALKREIAMVREDRVPFGTVLSMRCGAWLKRARWWADAGFEIGECQCGSTVAYAPEEGTDR